MDYSDEPEPYCRGCDDWRKLAQERAEKRDALRADLDAARRRCAALEEATALFESSSEMANREADASKRELEAARELLERVQAEAPYMTDAEGDCNLCGASPGDIHTSECLLTAVDEFLAQKRGG